MQLWMPGLLDGPDRLQPGRVGWASRLEGLPDVLVIGRDGHVDLDASPAFQDPPEEVQVPRDQRAPGLHDQPGSVMLRHHLEDPPGGERPPLHRLVGVGHAAHVDPFSVQPPRGQGRDQLRGVLLDGHPVSPGVLLGPGPLEEGRVAICAAEAAAPVGVQAVVVVPQEPVPGVQDLPNPPVPHAGLSQLRDSLRLRHLVFLLSGQLPTGPRAQSTTERPRSRGSRAGGGLQAVPAAPGAPAADPGDCSARPPLPDALGPVIPRGDVGPTAPAGNGPPVL